MFTSIKERIRVPWDGAQTKLVAQRRVREAFCARGNIAEFKPLPCVVHKDANCTKDNEAEYHHLDETGTTIAIEYVGRTDRPVLPIIISRSPEEADRYKQKLFTDPISTFARVYIVRDSTMKGIADIHLPNSGLSLPNSGDEPRTAPMLRLVLATGLNSREITVDVAESVSLLGEIKKRVSEYPPIVEQLSDLQIRMKRYLKQSH